MLVSVIVSLYNYEKYISDCLQSIINQDYDDYEIIVVDDCSTDNSFSVAKEFERDNISVIKLDINSGYSKAKNEGIIFSKGELITCLDADDLFTRNSLSVRVKCFKKRNALFVHAKAVSFRGDKSLEDCYAIDVRRAKRETPRIHAQAVMVKREVYQKYGLYDESLRSRSDKEMWWRLFGKDDNCKFKIKKYFLDKDVAYYRKHKKSMMVNRRKNPKLQKKLIKQLNFAYNTRQAGITSENTRFLGV